MNVSRLRPYTDGAELFPGRPVADAPPVELELDSDEPVFNQVLQFVARGRDKEAGRAKILLVRWRDERPDSWHTELELRNWCVAATGDSARFRELYKITPRVFGWHGWIFAGAGLAAGALRLAPGCCSPALRPLFSRSSALRSIRCLPALHACTPFSCCCLPPVRSPW